MKIVQLATHASIGELQEASVSLLRLHAGRLEPFLVIRHPQPLFGVKHTRLLQHVPSRWNAQVRWGIVARHFGCFTSKVNSQCSVPFCSAVPKLILKVAGLPLFQTFSRANTVFNSTETGFLHAASRHQRQYKRTTKAPPLMDAANCPQKLI